jgi:exonuclease III
MAGEKRWNGVAILARWAPVVTRVDLPGDDADGQCRYLEAAVNGVLVASKWKPSAWSQIRLPRRRAVNLDRLPISAYSSLLISDPYDIIGWKSRFVACW